MTLLRGGMLITPTTSLAADGGFAAALQATHPDGQPNFTCDLGMSQLSLVTDAAVRLGLLYTRTSESTFAAFDFFGEDTASAGWVTRFGSPARDNAAH